MLASMVTAMRDAGSSPGENGSLFQLGSGRSSSICCARTSASWNCYFSIR